MHGLYAARIDRDESKFIAAFGRGDLLRNRGVHTGRKRAKLIGLSAKAVSAVPARASPVRWCDGRGHVIAGVPNVAQRGRARDPTSGARGKRFVGQRRGAPRFDLL